MRNWKRKTLYLLGIYLWFEVLCFLGLHIIGRVSHLHYDPNTSWLRADQRERLREFFDRLQQGKPTSEVLESTLGWVVPRSETNAAGVRDDRERATEPAAGSVRIAAYGDSFTFADEVPLSKSWPRLVSEFAPSLDVLNYGVRAYGLDQAYLRYTMVGASYHPDIVFIGFMSENISRDVNTFRAFYANTYFPLAKPRFRAVNSRLVLVPNPLNSIATYENFLRNPGPMLKQMGANDYYYQRNYDYGNLDFVPSVRLGKILWHQIALRISQPIFLADGSYNVRSEAFDVTIRLFDAFYAKALENGAVPIILILPDEADQIRRRRGQPERYQPLVERIRSRQYRFIDLQGAIDPYESRDASHELFQPGGHYSEFTNRIVAQFIVAGLKQWGFLDVSTVKDTLRVERARSAKPLQ